MPEADYRPDPAPADGDLGRQRTVESPLIGRMMGVSMEGEGEPCPK